MSELAKPEVFRALLVFAGSGLGGLARYGIESIWTGRTTTNGDASFPWAVLAINATGSLAIGVLSGMIVREDMRALLLVGLLGGYTTFSAFSRDVAHMAQHGRWMHAAMYVLASVTLSIGACWLGATLGGYTGAK